MAEGPPDSARSRGFRPLGGIGGRAAAATLRPITGLAFDELEQLLATMLESEHVQRGLRRALEGDGARQLVDDFFDSGVFDHFIERLLASPELWHLIDEVAASPAVTAAISQQGLGFADQVAGEIRRRSRRADDLLERTAHRLVPGRQRIAEAGDDGPGAVSP